MGEIPSADTKVPPDYDPRCPRLESQHRPKASVSETQTQALEMTTRKRGGGRHESLHLWLTLGSKDGQGVPSVWRA